jgi:hypothetical protein
MVVPAYPPGAETVKRSWVSLMIAGRGMAGAIVVITGTGVVGTGVGTVVGTGVMRVVGNGVGVGVGWTACWVHPAVTSRTAIAQVSAISNEVFIRWGTRPG